MEGSWPGGRRKDERGFELQAKEAWFLAGPCKVLALFYRVTSGGVLTWVITDVEKPKRKLTRVAFLFPLSHSQSGFLWWTNSVRK